MKRRTTILVLVASVALAACGKKDDNNTTPNNTTSNNTTNNTTTTNNATNNTTTPTNNVTSPTNNVTSPTNNVTTGPPATCDEYCDAVMANCTGDDAQYSSRDECVDYCANVAGWDPGTGADTEGNTVSCRAYHAGDPAIADSVTHCPHAGPTGANVCGTWCDNYCELALANCTGANQVYADEATCMTACGAFDATGSPGDVKYDTVQCRIYHAGAPAATDPVTHCPHAQETPTEVCVGSASTFNFVTNVPADYTRVDRMGMPAISTALITNKGAYNDGNPTNDNASMFAGEIVGNLAALHNALDDDLVAATLVPCSPATACVGQQIVAGGPTVGGLVIPDTLKINPTTASGFPNGRRLADPVMDVTLAIILLDMTFVGQNPNTLLGLNPEENDLGVEGAFLTAFPYLHPPHVP